MIDQINESQWPSYRPPMGQTEGSASEQLGKQAESFYAWYLLMRRESYPSDGYQGLQHIMQMCKHGTPTDGEAQEALEKLMDLSDALDGGAKTVDQIPYEISLIIDRLTENNPKSRLIKQATQIEMSVNLGNGEAPEELGELMHQLVDKITPEMPKIKAESLSRTLDEALSQPSPDLKGLKDRISHLI